MQDSPPPNSDALLLNLRFPGAAHLGMRADICPNRARPKSPRFHRARAEYRRTQADSARYAGRCRATLLRLWNTSEKLANFCAASAKFWPMSDHFLSILAPGIGPLLVQPSADVHTSFYRRKSGNICPERARCWSDFHGMRGPHPVKFGAYLSTAVQASSKRHTKVRGPSPAELARRARPGWPDFGQDSRVTIERLLSNEARSPEMLPRHPGPPAGAESGREEASWPLRQAFSRVSRFRTPSMEFSPERPTCA